MVETDLEAIGKRLHALTQQEGEEPYIFGEVLRSVIAKATANAIPLEVSNAGQELDRSYRTDRENLEKTLARWVIGEASDDLTLAHLFPLAVHYSDGAIQLDEGENIEDYLDGPELERFPFSREVIKAFFRVGELAPNAIKNKHLQAWDEVDFEREMGVGLNDFRAKLKKDRDLGRGGNNSCVPPRG